MKSYPAITLLLFALCAPLVHGNKTQSQRNTPLSPEEQLKTFRLPEGYVIELVASEADGVINPIDLAFDDAGRLWTQTARMYPLDPAKDIPWNKLLELMNSPEAQQKDPEFKRILDLYQGRTKGEDRILVLSDLYGGGKVRASVFADGLAIPQSILPYRKGAFVAQGSELFFLEDTDQDGVADKRTPVLTGFGFTDTHTMAHTLVRGPGNWIYFSHGALNMGEVTAIKSGARERFDYSKIGRFSIDGERLEVVSCGLNNIWGFWMRPDGQWWGTEANDQGWSVTPMEPGTGFKGIGNRRIRPYQPLFPPLHNFRVGGTGISGLAFNDDLAEGFPAEWRDVAFLANPITNSINAVRVSRNGDGTVSAEHLPDFLTSSDDWFRPVNMEFGPDGCLYIVDWYNKIVSHNEVARTHPDRDKAHGRIWRIRYTKAARREVPDLEQATPTQLLAHLSSSSAWQRRAALNQITDRGLDDLAGPLTRLAADESAHEHARIHALWALEGLHHHDAGLMQALLASRLPNLRREAVRAMAGMEPDLPVFNKEMAVAIKDAVPMVRSAALRAIAERGQADEGTIDVLVSACAPEIPGNRLGGSYERSFERYLARMALEKYETQLSAYLGGQAASRQPAGNLLWASQALPEDQRNSSFGKIWKHTDPAVAMDESTFVILAKSLSIPQAFEIAKPLLQHQGHGPTYVRYALNNQSQVQSPQLSELLKPVLVRMLDDRDRKIVALDGIELLHVAVDSKHLMPHLNGPDATPAMVGKVLKALQVDPKNNLAAIESLAKDAAYPLAVRLSASHSLVQIAPKQGEAQLEALLAMLADDQLPGLVGEFSGSQQGAALLLAKFKQSKLKPEAFDVSSAERIQQFHKRSKEAEGLLKQSRARETEARNALAGRIQRLIKVTDELEGNPETGKLLFNTCLMCHKVGDRGFDIAPALDGSAHREKEALLTAILNPNAAVEGGYQLFRVRKKDNATLEGYRYQDDETGVTLAFMGGAKVFIPAAEIASREFVAGRSFMPTGLIDAYSDQNVADLLSFISTLK